MKKPIIICAQQRSGTTVLQRAFGTSPKVKNFGEIFHDYKIDNKDIESYFVYRRKLIGEDEKYCYPIPKTQRELFNSYIDHLSGLCKNKYFVLDIKYNSWHHFNHTWQGIVEPPFMYTLVKQKAFPIIHLIRRNAFKRSVSFLIATAKQQWHFEKSENLDNGKIRIEPIKCLQHMRMSISRTYHFSQWLQNYNKSIELIYEDLFDEETGHFNLKSFANIYKLVGENLQMNKEPQLKKIIKSLNETIENKQELIDFFDHTEFSTMVRNSFTK